MTEEITQDFANEVVCGAEFVIDIGTKGRVSDKGRNLRKSIAYREENAVDLGVFVFKKSQISQVR
jgi:hypothetical protein